MKVNFKFLLKNKILKIYYITTLYIHRYAYVKYKKNGQEIGKTEGACTMQHVQLCTEFAYVDKFPAQPFFRLSDYPRKLCSETNRNSPIVSF